ncbi:hypothetical protein [Nostoc sp. UHCC 0251]|uniref:hypothetical protein n=1 Tax=Nostoc sp. UHCC 0251 TaxID=3110240 RepID=UPI002B205A01|nr:hypothetical protein [Nostoc sp. UHCC 0251]MEA5623996.1 hypothetical protein [Nostoc sp. UHCC 0251]
MIVSDLLFFDVSISEESDIRGGQSPYDSGGYYYVPKEKYECYSYYNEKWGGTYYKCYQDKYIPKIPKKELGGGTLLS